MTDIQKSTLKGVAFALIAFGLFSTHDVFVKLLGAHYAPAQIIFFGVIFSFPLATLMLMRDRMQATLRPVHPWWTALRTGTVVVTGLSAFYAFTVLPLAQVYTILFASPLLITLLSIPILSERVGLHRLAAVALGLTGVLIVLRPGSEPLTLGHGAALTAAFGSATAAVVVRKIAREERSVVLMLYPMVASFLVMASILPFVYVPMPIEHLGQTAVISLLAFTAGLLVIAAYRSGEAAVIAPMQYSQLLWAAVYGALLFGERPDRITWIGAAVIISSGLYIVIRESTIGASRHTPVLGAKPRYEPGTGPKFTLFHRSSGPVQDPLAKAGTDR